MGYFKILFIILVVVLIVNIFIVLSYYFCFSTKDKFTTPPQNIPRIIGEKKTWTFYRVNMSEKTFFNLINQWIANEQGIVVLSFHTDGFSSYGFNLLHRFYTSVTLIYTYSNQSSYKYGIDSFQKYKYSRSVTSGEIREYCNKKYPGAEIVQKDSVYSSWRSDSAGTNTQTCILYRYPIGNANVMPQKVIVNNQQTNNGLTHEQNQVKVVYCTKCGQKMQYGTKFCTKCGNSMMNISPSNANVQKAQNTEKQGLQQTQDILNQQQQEKQISKISGR